MKEPVDTGYKTNYNESGAGQSFTKMEPAEFHQKFHAVKDAVANVAPEKAWRVDGSYTAEDYADMDCFTTPGGSCVAVHHGDIVSVCGMPGDKVRGSDLLKYAIQMGGNKLDAFSGLYGFYAKNGFEPVSWCEFDERYAPPDWKKGRDEPEPVIFWKHTGRSYQDIVKDHGLNADEFITKVAASAGYDAAKEARNKSMEG